MIFYAKTMQLLLQTVILWFLSKKKKIILVQVYEILSSFTPNE